MKSAVLWTLHVYRSSCLGHRRSWCGDGGTAQAVSQTDSCMLIVWARPRGWRGHMGWTQSSHQSLPAGHSRRLTEPKTLGSLSKATSAPLICMFWIQPVKDVLTGNAKLLKVPVYIKQKKENGNIIHHMQAHYIKNKKQPSHLISKMNLIHCGFVNLECRPHKADLWSWWLWRLPGQLYSFHLCQHASPQRSSA